MRLKFDRFSKPTGYTLWLSERDVENWATKPNASWPCSDLRGHRCMVQVDSNGLCDFTIDGKGGEVNGAELDAIVSDHLPAALRHLWPVWEGSNAE